MELLGFWSYVHADDETDMGRVTQLARDIVSHYEAIMAEEITLFLDRDDLHWGDQWRDKIDDALSNVAFFIPVLTPRYFGRVECRREMQFFIDKSERLGISELVLPILYIDVPGLALDEPSDPLMRMLKGIQWTPWIDLRFEDRSSAAYRRAVESLAQELVRRTSVVERADIVAAVVSSEGNAADTEAGTLDKIAALETAMPRWSSTLDSIRAEIEEIGAIMVQGTADMAAGDKQGKGFAARLSVARRLASQLDGPVEKIEVLGQQFARDLSEIDSGVRVLVENGRDEWDDASDEDREALREFFQSLETLAQSSREGLGSVEEMIAASQPLEGMSKDMRAPLRKLRGSLTAMVEARDVTDQWEALVEDFDLS